MSLEKFSPTQKQESPSFTLNLETEEATVELPNERLLQLFDITLTDGEVLSTLTGRDVENNEVVIDIIDNRLQQTADDLEVIKVVVSGETVYEVTRH